MSFLLEVFANEYAVINIDITAKTTMNIREALILIILRKIYF